ncbi:MAG TPA: hypothetical protein PK748_04165, partial [Acidimicrobiales bacterium]|nr:hypothetical protein [Acidimicrobiales bacterium]
GFIGEEIDEIREQVAPDLFTAFDRGAFPSSSLPALALARAAYRWSPAAGEAVSLELRNLLFEVGEDIGDPVVLARVGDAHGVVVDAEDVTGVLTDHEEGVRRGVIGSPHFFTADGSFFCPALDVGRDPAGHLRITADPEGFESFLARCFA